MADQQEQEKIDGQYFPDRLCKEYHHGKADQKLCKADLVSKMLLIPVIQLFSTDKEQDASPSNHAYYNSNPYQPMDKGGNGRLWDHIP